MNEKDLLFYTFNNVYIVDCQTILNFEGLRQDLINEVKRDTIENREDKDIVENNLKLLEDIYNINKGYNERFIIDELKLYGASILRVQDLVDGLIDLQNYYKNNDITNGNNELVNNINVVLKDTYNVFND